MILRLYRLALLSLCILLINGSNQSIAANKFAYIVGIDLYSNLSLDQQLQKAVGDSRSIEAAFVSLGFKVSQIENPTRKAFFDGWGKFTQQLSAGDIAVVYFSGHGVEINGANYLLPRDIPDLSGNRSSQITNQAISLSGLQRDLKQIEPKLSLLIVDACRNNPFSNQGTKSLISNRGLRAPKASVGTFIMYSADEGEEALDRLGNEDQHPNSIYTRELVPLLRQGNLTLVQIAKKVREKVELTAMSVDHRQFPGYYDATRGDFCLGGACESQVVVPPRKSSWYLAEYRGIDFFGGDIHENGILADTLKVCENACQNNLECRLFTFDQDNRTCWLKRKLQIPLEDSDKISGTYLRSAFGSPTPRPVKVEWELYFNKALNLGALGGKSIQSSISECAHSCERGNCKAFTAYNKGTNRFECERKRYFTAGTQSWSGATTGYPIDSKNVYPTQITPILLNSDKLAIVSAN